MWRTRRPNASAHRVGDLGSGQHRRPGGTVGPPVVAVRAKQRTDRNAGDVFVGGWRIAAPPVGNGNTPSWAAIGTRLR
jgi:hypothetical protein